MAVRGAGGSGVHPWSSGSGFFIKVILTNKVLQTNAVFAKLRGAAMCKPRRTNDSWARRLEVLL